MMNLCRALLLCLLLAARTPCHDAVKFMMKKTRGETAETQKSSETAAASTCDEMLTKTLAQTIDDKATALLEREEAHQAHQTALEEIEKLKGELQSTTESLTSEMNTLLSNLVEMEKEHEQKVETMNREHEEQTQKIRLESRKLVEEAETQRDEKVREVQQAMDELRSETTRRLETTEKDVASELAALAAEHKQVLDEKNAEMSTIVAELKTEIKSIHEQAERDTETLTEVYTIRQRELELEAQETIANLTLDHDTKMNDLLAKVGKLEQVSESWKSQFEALEAKYYTASKELAELQAVQATRSYCNLTYVQEDAIAAASVAQQKVKEQLVVAADQATKAARRVSEKAAVVAAPSLQKSWEMYDQSVKPKVNLHVAPVYNQHVSPLVKKADVLLRALASHLSSMLSAIHQSLVNRFSFDCPKIRKRLEGSDSPAFLLSHVEEACDDPEGSVNRYLVTLACIIAFVFRSFLWKSLTAVILFPFQLMWFFSPLRLLLKTRDKRLGDDIEDDRSITPVKADPIKSSPSQ